MPRNTGIYSPPASSWNPPVTGVPATPADWAALLADITAALTQSVSADGQTVITNDLSMSNHKITNVTPGTNSTDAATLGQLTPVGAIAAWVGGYFTSGANAGFTNVLGNTVALANARLNSLNWYVCDGAALNLPGSPIFNAAGRYLPNLTDNRFIQGSSTCGGIGGATADDHVHGVAAHSHTTGDLTLGITQIPSHYHSVPSGGAVQNVHGVEVPAAQQVATNTGSAGGGLAHNHGATSTVAAANTGGATVTENRPLFLSCFYIMKVA